MDRLGVPFFVAVGLALVASCDAWLGVPPESRIAPNAPLRFFEAGYSDGKVILRWKDQSDIPILLNGAVAQPPENPSFGCGAAPFMRGQ